MFKAVWQSLPTNALRIATSLRSGSYLSHASAMWVHGISSIAPTRIVLNKEQSPKPKSSGKLTQSGIDRAFAASKQRSSNFVFKFDGNELVLLSGKNTSRLGVIPMSVGKGKADTTSLERTLIDIAVRPSYAGGISAVAQAYKLAIDRASVQKLRNLLEELDYMYPYHQVIGYYMQRAGASKADLNKLKWTGMKFNFYLTYGMKQKELNADWKLYVPPEGEL